jgi:CheY-like chemotaxis protein
VIAAETPVWVLADANRLRQILLNLIGNSIKFSSAGVVTLRVRSMEPDPRTRMRRLRFEVQDYGIGMTVETRRHIFEPFRQADESMTRGYGGTGLGLSITHKLITRMGGTIEVESELGSGSTFRFDLELESCGLPSAGLMATEALSPTRGGRRILVVDDNPVNRKVACALLQRSGHETIEAADGVEAVERVLTDVPDIVLMDCQMPRMDGYEATRQIRLDEAKKGKPRLPIMALTANALPNEREKCLRAGMDEYLVKPFKPKDLLSSIDLLLRESGEPREAA